MKKYILSLTSIIACASPFAQDIDSSYFTDTITNPSLSYVQISTSVGYETKYVYRGEERAEDSLQANVNISYPLATGLSIYLDAWANAPMSRGAATDEYTEVDTSIGFQYYYGKFAFDLGFTYYWYTDYEPIENTTQEIYLGVSMDTSDYLGVNLSPSLYYFYDATLDQHALEFSLSYNTDIGYALTGQQSGFSMPMRVYAGWLTTADFVGTLSWEDFYQLENILGDIELSNNYWYVGATIDLAYTMNDYCNVSVGARVSYSNGDERYEGKEKTIFWAGARIDFGF